MRELVFKNAVEREPGYLYFVDAEGSIWRAKLSRGGRKKKEKSKDE